MKKVKEQSLGKLADAAFRQAAEKAIERAEQTGTPVILWDGQAVKAVSPRKARSLLNGNSARAVPRRRRVGRRGV